MKRISRWGLLALVLAAVLLLTAQIPVAQAAETQEPLFVSEFVTKVNPLYANGAVPAPAADAGTMVVHQAADFQGAVKEMRKFLKNRETQATVEFPVVLESDLTDGAALGEELMALEETLRQNAMAHTGKGDEGDYLLWSYFQYSVGFNLREENGQLILGVIYRFEYHSSAQQEAELGEFITVMLDSWHLENATDYEKVCAVYDWLCENVRYSQNIVYGPSTIYSAYGAVMEWDSVCQGYALAMYRMLLDLGVDCRVITGIGNGGDHAWNIVKLGDCYYNADATWDAVWYEAGQPYGWFLTCDANFPDHYRDSGYMTESFYARYPMGQADYVPGEEDDGLSKFQGTSVSLGDSLDMHFFLNAVDMTTADYALVTREYADGRGSETVEILSLYWGWLDDMVYITYSGIAAKEMGDTVTVTVYDAWGNAISETYTDSVQAYAMRMLEKESDPALLTLLVDMLNYGAEAQIFFGYMEESLANEDLTAAQKAYGSGSYQVADCLEAGTGRAATALTLKNRISLDLFFDCGVTGTDYDSLYAVAAYTDHYGYEYELWIHGENFREAEGNRVYVSVPGLAIADYGQVVTCTVYDAEGNVLAWVTDSIGGYVARMEDNIPEIVAAIARFGNTAYSYFHN